MNQKQPDDLRETRNTIRNISGFARKMTGVRLRPYQVRAAEAIIQSVYERDGESFVVIFARQSGKDEMLAHIFLFLMLRFGEWGAEMVCAQPTFKPQTVNAMERLMRRGLCFEKALKRTAGYIFRLGQARLSYFSAEPSAHQVGATAERLLVINEAQDVSPAVYDKRFAPMTASGFATKVFSGTVWTSDTLLSREMRFAREKEQRDGRPRLFLVDADEVSRSNPNYRRHVKEQVRRMGRQHPLVKSQYFCEEVDAQAGMFNAARMAMIFRPGPEIQMPLAGFGGRHPTAFLIDVAGQDEAAGQQTEAAVQLTLEGLGNPGRDSTTLSIVQVDLSTLATLQAPTYRVVQREAWQGLDHLTIFGKLKALAEAWNPLYIVIDATGVGEGLWSMLHRLYPTRTLPVKFTRQSKSEIGWKFLGIVETGRFQSLADDETVRTQYRLCQSEVLPGPARTLRWGVKDGTRGPDGLLVHDDHLLADALVAILDAQKWTASTLPVIKENRDVFDELREEYGDV